MGVADIVFGELKSQVVRKFITENDEGNRVITKTNDEERKSSNLLQKIGGFFGGALKFVGWIVKSVFTGISFTFSSAWGILVNTAQFIWNFNWNASDRELDSYLAGVGRSMAGLAGGTLGNLVGYLVCGVTPAAVITTFNEPLGIELLREVGEEALEELASNLSNLTQQAFYLGVQWLFINAYKATRRLIKSVLNGTGKVAQLLNRALGGNASRIRDNWGADGAKPWSFAIAWENFLDSIGVDCIRDFTEEFFEEAFDSCVEAGYIIAGGIDNWVAQQRLAKPMLLGQNRILEVTPNREIPDEKIILAGSEELIKPTLVQTLNNYNLVENRDIGQFMGAPVRTFVRKDPLELGIKIVWKTKRNPPWGADCETVECNIEGLKPNYAREWTSIKALAGGENGFNWGRFRCVVNLSNGGQFVIHGNTADEAEQIANMLLNLTEHTLLTMRTSELKRVGRAAQNQPLFIEDKRVYPAFMTVINRSKILNEWDKEKREGQSTLTGTYKQRKFQIPLWTSNPPRNYDDIITELLRDGTGTA